MGRKNGGRKIVRMERDDGQVFPGTREILIAITGKRVVCVTQCVGGGGRLYRGNEECTRVRKMSA